MRLSAIAGGEERRRGDELQRPEETNRMDVSVGEGALVGVVGVVRRRPIQFAVRWNSLRTRVCWSGQRAQVTIVVRQDATRAPGGVS